MPPARTAGRKGRPWRRIRQQVIAASNGTCAICGHPINLALPGTHPNGPSVDHIVPLSEGGPPLDPANLRATHLRCNSRRGNGRKQRNRTSRRW